MPRVETAAACREDTAADLPEWPARTIAILSTLDGAPHAIPISAPVRAGERRILFSLRRDRDSVARIRACPRVALTILAAGDVAFTARGRAHLVEAVLDGEYLGVELAVDAVDDH